MRRFVAGLAMLSLGGLLGATAGAAPTIITNVPDWNQPADYGDFVAPQDPPPAFQPAGPFGVASWCTPTAAANLIGWYEDQGLAKYAGIADGAVFPNTLAGGYPDNSTSGLPKIPDNLADWQQSLWHDGQLELGWFMDTQGWRTNNPGLMGTTIINTPAGIMNYLKNVAPGQQWSAWQVNDKADQSYADYQNGGKANNGVQLGDVTLVHWDTWIKTEAANTYTDDANQLIFYDWKGADSPIGHTVTGVGFWSQYDPDGVGPLQQSDWLICLDNWPSTGYNSGGGANTGLMAVPWDTAKWQANTHLQYVGVNAKAQPGQPGFEGGTVIPSSGLPNGLPYSQVAADNWLCTTGEPITKIRWWGTEAPVGMAAWDVSIYEGASQPDTLVQQYTIAPSMVSSMPTGRHDGVGNDIFDNVVVLPGDGFAQVAGTSYWLKIDPLSSIEDGWGWLTADTNQAGDAMVFDGETWQPTGVQLAFEVYEADPEGPAVPEPATLSLLALGALVVTIRRRS